jgi:hypothetical protein
MEIKDNWLPYPLMSPVKFDWYWVCAVACDGELIQRAVGYYNPRKDVWTDGPGQDTNQYFEVVAYIPDRPSVISREQLDYLRKLYADELVAQHKRP